MSTLSVIEHGDILVVDSRLIAKRLEIQHESFMRTIYKYQNRVERKFGHLRFEIGTVTNSTGATNEVKYALLTEPQATAFMTFSRNNDKVVDCKLELVDAFEKAKKIIKGGNLAESIQIVDVISQWLVQAKVDEAIASMWKLDQLGRRHPELKPETESAKQLIGGTNATDSQYLTPTELGDRVGMSARDMNKALVAARLQVQGEDAKGKKKWDLTDEGKKYGIVFLASGQNNRWSGGQVKWLPTVLDVLGLNQQSA